MLVEHNGKFVPRFHVQDTVHFNGNFLNHLSHPERMALAKREVLDPRVDAMNTGIILRREESPLWLTPQVFWPVEEAHHLLAPGFLNFRCKGLRFVPKNEVTTRRFHGNGVALLLLLNSPCFF